MKILWWYLPIEALIVLLAQQALGFSVEHALMMWGSVAAATILLAALPDIRLPRWQEPPADRRDGARDQIGALAWAFMTRDETVSPRGMQSVRDAAAARLALHGVDLADSDHAPAARALLGDAVFHLLTRDGPPLTVAQVGRCIDRLAALPTTAPAPRPAPSPSLSQRTT